MDTPGSSDCAYPSTWSGISSPAHSRIVGTMSTAWWYWLRTSPRAAMPFGHEITSGSATPPW